LTLATALLARHTSSSSEIITTDII
jgi:hypothetical protein